ncbi:MAG: division/cell wall cluster transcriptional repressor MraZ [Defluviitaleaceae bacterium]|nr:division/cell wall cluster transcriptional repressor MraZ [Defluviitaleaceae bacterium]
MTFETKLLGKNFHSLDTKGRLIVPARFREELGSSFVVAISLDKKCITLYPLSEWNKMREKFAKMPTFNKKVVIARRQFFSNSHPCETDPQGRFLIPLDLREAVGITKEVVTVGMEDYIEIWSKERWQLEGPDTYEIDDDIFDELSALE